MTASLVDWDLAVSTAVRLVRPGPDTTPDEARTTVGALREYAAEARAHVAAYTGMTAPGEGSSVAVIDRPSWVRANVSGFRQVLDPLVEKIQATRPPSAAAAAVGAKATGVQTGTLLAFLASKVLGQYELFPPYAGLGPGGVAAAPPGRLLLVAPNIAATEREMGVDPRDFRLWVCLHEETHRVQFGAVPWLRAHVLREIGAFVAATDVEPAVLASRLRSAAGAALSAMRAGAAPDDDSDSGGGSLLEAMQTPEQREILDRITALMSLLEGHADFVMDGVGPAVIPSVATIRARFQRRRKDTGRVETVVRRLLGIEAKLRQYRDGERFVRGVVTQAGMDGLNQVWSSPEALPTKDELGRPTDWVDRVVGTRRLAAE